MKIELANVSQKDEILKLYKTHLYGPAAWDEHYPSMDTIEFDLSRNALYVAVDDEGAIIGTISIDQDPDVECLTCWSSELQPSQEFSRVCVRNDMKRMGIAGKMVEHVLDVMREDGCKSAHILVKTENSGAKSLYEKKGFFIVGDCELFGKTFICMERKLEITEC